MVRGMEETTARHPGSGGATWAIMLFHFFVRGFGEGPGAVWIGLGPSPGLVVLVVAVAVAVAVAVVGGGATRRTREGRGGRAGRGPGARLSSRVPGSTLSVSWAPASFSLRFGLNSSLAQLRWGALLWHVYRPLLPPLTKRSPPNDCCRCHLSWAF